MFNRLPRRPSEIVAIFFAFAFLTGDARADVDAPESTTAAGIESKAGIQSDAPIEADVLHWREPLSCGISCAYVLNRLLEHDVSYARVRAMAVSVADPGVRPD